ncbi:peptidase M23 [Algimonas arctica]|uniref:Peptidase M23 n=2 Tax=Algimonas arctica TaxID=1479486 RepID=A0A8J3CRK9_9PROT|nr:peptidase M23 [Algimonas arctica]
MGGIDGAVRLVKERSMRFALLPFIWLLLALNVSAMAQQAPDLESLAKAEAEARKTEARLKTEREKVIKEIAALKAELARDTQQTQAFERESQRITEKLSDSTVKLQKLGIELAANRDSTLELFASLQRLQLRPSVATLAHPDDAVRTAQAATMIDLLSGQLRERAKVTQQLAENVASARDEALTQQDALDANAAELLRRKTRTQALVAQKEKLRLSIQTDEEEARADAARFASEAATLRELIDKVAAIPESVTPRLKPGLTPDATPLSLPPIKLPPGTVRFADAKGGMVRPVSGSMTEGFGRSSKGQTYSARSGGQVIAPYAGRVEFVGPFRTYGRVVILNMDDGYYLLLTGLSETYVTTSETVKRGEPVGLMPGTSGRTPLYIELRRNGRSIDPEPWMGGRG